MKKSKFLFVIDTEQYAGNFEREVCAYVTGVTGECGVGEENQEQFNKEVKDTKSAERLQNKVAQVADDDDGGCCRPCVIWPTPGWFNHGMGGHFRQGQDKEAIADYIKEVEKYENENIKRVESNRKLSAEYRKRLGWTDAAIDRKVADSKKDIEKAKKLKKPRKFPAYLSVAIWFETKPTTEEIAFMKERAQNFKSRWGKNLTITGFRVIKQEIKHTEEEAV